MNPPQETRATGRRPYRTVMLAVLAILAVGLWSPVASADTSSVRSEPNGDLRVTVSVGAVTDKDKDGNIDTATQGDVVSLFFAVINQSDVTQPIRIDYLLDGPGTEADRFFSLEVVLEPDGIHQEREELRIHKTTTPVGDYTLTVSGSGTESASASATFTVQSKG